MNLNLRIAFDSEIRSQINISNPPHIPDFGDIVGLKPEDFLTDIEDINKAIAYAENCIWYVGLKTITYEKDMVEILIVLEEEEHFKVNYPNYWARYK